MSKPDVQLQPPLYRSGRMTFRLAKVPLRGGGFVERGLVQHPGSVVIAARTDDDQLVMIRNARWTVGQTLLELPAGTLTAGEDPAIAAGRELVEETGWQAESMVPVCDFYAAPGSSNERMWAFSATGLRHVGQQLEADERIEVELVAWSQLGALLCGGRVKDAKSLAVLGVLLASTGSGSGSGSGSG